MKVWDVFEYKIWKGIDPDNPVWASRGFACPTWEDAKSLMDYLEGNCPKGIFRVELCVI